MSEMIRCLVCGRASWGAGLKGLDLGARHQIQTLRVSSSGDRGIKNTRIDRSHDAEYLKAWVEKLDLVKSWLLTKLEQLGEVEWVRANVVMDQVRSRRVGQSLPPAAARDLAAVVALERVRPVDSEAPSPTRDLVRPAMIA